MNPQDLKALGGAIDSVLNQDPAQPKVGFCMLIFGFGAPGISNYISNAERGDMIKALREAADRLEKGQDNVRH